MIITFSGVDGSGKTTQSRYVAQLLQSRGYSVRYIHMTRWTWVYAIGQLSKGRRERDYSLDGACLRSNLLGRLMKMVRQIVSLVDLLRFRWCAFYQTRVRRRVLVCDRFFYDLGVQALYTDMMGPNLARWYWSLVPTPTVPILLDVPPEMAQRREGQHLSAYYQTKCELYLEYASLWRAVVIEATELEDTKQAVNRVLNKHFESGNV
jgi:thymidylate kinase